jgi:hypothetical protein
MAEDEESPFSELHTLDDFWGLIQRECLQDCPVSGAHSCSIEYAMHLKGGFVFPEVMNVVRNSFDGFLGRIENVQVIPCPEEIDEVEKESKDSSSKKKKMKKPKRGKKSSSLRKNKKSHRK